MNNYSSIHTNIFTNCLPPSSQGWGMQLYTKWYTSSSKVKEVNKLRNTAPTPLSDTTYYSMDINITGSDTLFYTTTILHIMASLSSASFHAPKKKKMSADIDKAAMTICIRMQPAVAKAKRQSTSSHSMGVL